ncbi:conserved exported hypothetical protein [metagenome]|uniref:PKD domain-containing protein n=1 Tax=metagenome TaxID=256318 RepID=A0A2P2C8Y7_9ZZZZ
MTRFGAWFCGLLIACSLPVAVAMPAMAGCETVADDLGEVSQNCEYIDSELSEAISQQSASKWEIYQICGKGTSGGGEICDNPRTCELSGVRGTWYVVMQDGVTVGRACLTAAEGTKYDNPPIRTLVIRAFDTLDWPKSALTVQPRGGRTLVNLKTNFYTDNIDFTDISVTLVESNVTVSARPVAYRWNFGDGTSQITTSAGAPYPDLDIAHVYQQTEEVAVSVDTQYGDASFTVGGRPPESIPSTIWVAGAESDLEILEALPQLVLE